MRRGEHEDCKQRRHDEGCRNAVLVKTLIIKITITPSEILHKAQNMTITHNGEFAVCVFGTRYRYLSVRDNENGTALCALAVYTAKLKVRKAAERMRKSNDNKRHGDFDAV